MPLLPLIWRYAAAGALGVAVREGQESFLEGAEEAQPQTIVVSSSAISSIGWQPPGTIVVTFHRGGHITYTYPGTYEDFKEFRDAPSKGAHFNLHFR